MRGPVEQPLPIEVGQGDPLAVRLATLAAGGPTGGAFDDDGPVPW